MEKKDIVKKWNSFMDQHRQRFCDNRARGMVTHDTLEFPIMWDRSMPVLEHLFYLYRYYIAEVKEFCGCDEADTTVKTIEDICNGILNSYRIYKDKGIVDAVAEFLAAGLKRAFGRRKMLSLGVRLVRETSRRLDLQGGARQGLGKRIVDLDGQVRPFGEEHSRACARELFGGKVVALAVDDPLLDPVPDGDADEGEYQCADEKEEPFRRPPGRRGENH